MKIPIALVTCSLLAACTPRTNTATDVIPPGGRTPDAVKEDPTPEPVAAASPAASPAPDAGVKGPVYLVRDSGKRCITSPCPSWVAVEVVTRVEKEITGIDVGALKLGDAEAGDARRKLLAGQAWASGEIKTVPKQGPAGDGTVLFVSAIHDAPPKTQK